MPLEAFNSSASIISVLNGGVNSVGRSVLLGQQSIHADAVRSIEESFASRIDEAKALFNQTDISPKVEALRREQTILVSRKARLNQAIELLNKTLTQTKLIKEAIKHLADILDRLELPETVTLGAGTVLAETSVRTDGVVVNAGTVLGTNTTFINAKHMTPAEVTTDWDNTLRKINILVEGATVTYRDGNVSYEKNLIKSDGSRTSFPNRSFLAPFNSNGDTLLINGSYLGTDYVLQEVSGTFNVVGTLSGSTIWKSDSAFLATEEETGTLTEFTSKAGFPGSPTGVSGTVNDPDVTITNSGQIIFFEFSKNFTSSNSSTAAHVGKDIVFWIDSFKGITNLQINAASVEKGGLGILDAWLYNDFAETNFANQDATGTRVRARDDLGVQFLVNATAKKSDSGAMTKLVFAEKQFQHALDTLQSRANLFDPVIASIENEISDITQTSLNEKEAIVSSLELASQVAQFDLAILASRGDTIVFSLLMSQDNFNNGLGTSFKSTGDALLGATLSIQA